LNRQADGVVDDEENFLEADRKYQTDEIGGGQNENRNQKG
jgi:hypothetical protein